MIRPGLVTASISRADHFGRSVAVVLACSIVACSFSVWFVFEGSFPLVATGETRLGRPLRTPQGAMQWSTRSAAQSCADGLSFTMEAQRGMDCGDSVAAADLYDRWVDRVAYKVSSSSTILSSGMSAAREYASSTNSGGSFLSHSYFEMSL